MRFLSRSTIVVLLIILAGSLLAWNPIHADQATGQTYKYIGAKGCHHCHATEKNGRIYEKWAASDHAQAFEHLGEAHQDDEACLACHTTGYRQPIAAGTTADQLRGVQCEACHGPGSEYKAMRVMKNRELSQASGLTQPNADQCRQCHASQLPRACWGGAGSSPAFDYRDAYERIAHRIPTR